MATALTLDTLPGVPDVTDREEFVQGVIVLSGNYTTGGDPLSFAGTNKIQSRRPPNRVEIYEEPVAGTQTATGDIFIFAKGTTQANGTLQIFTSGSGGTGTIVSTSTAPTITTTTNASTAAPIYVTGGALTEIAGATGITGVQAPIITSTFSGTGGSAAQFPSGAYGSTFATTTIKFRAWFPLGQ
jgi:hypothetical protein